MLDLVEQIQSYSPQTGQQQPPRTYPIDSNPHIAKAPLINDSQKMNVSDQPPKQEENKGFTRFFTLQYYKEYFNITELDVLARIKAAVIPPFKQDFIEMITPNPDLYGPLWVQATIIFLLGTIGNFSNYIESKFSDDQMWNDYFFQLVLVRYAFVMVYSFGFGVPILLYFAFKCMGNPLSLPILISTYGYSNACYILATLLCIFPIGFLQWIFMLYAFGNSSLFLIVALRKHLQGMPAKQLPVIIVILAIQFLLFLCTKIIFIGFSVADK